VSHFDQKGTCNKITHEALINYSSPHQLKLMDSKCKSSVEQDAQIDATSCLIFLGPLTRTPILDLSQLQSISAENENVSLFKVFREHNLLSVSNKIYMKT
jgi:hypothetical protein